MSDIYIDVCSSKWPPTSADLQAEQRFTDWTSTGKSRLSLQTRRKRRQKPTWSRTTARPQVYVEPDGGEELLCLGFPNLQQTCYMNSTLQGLLTLTTFVQEVHNQEGVWRHCPNLRIMSGFVEVECCHYSQNRMEKTFVLAAFKDIVGNYNAEFQDGRQKDAHEFLSCILDLMRTQSIKLQEAALTVGISYTCPIKAHFAFHMLNTRTCTACAHRSTTEEDYSNLSLALVPGGSVSDCLEEHLRGSHLEYACACGSAESMQHFSFSTLPNVLILQLKRFTFSSVYSQIKLDHPVLVSRELNLDFTGDRKIRYSLVSVISHLGRTPAAGHYVCDGAQRRTAGGAADRWLTFNDSEVLQTTRDSVCRQRLRTAYVLFYQMETSSS